MFPEKTRKVSRRVPIKAHGAGSMAGVPRPKSGTPHKPLVDRSTIAWVRVVNHDSLGGRNGRDQMTGLVSSDWRGATKDLTTMSAKWSPINSVPVVNLLVRPVLGTIVTAS